MVYLSVGLVAMSWTCYGTFSADHRVQVHCFDDLMQRVKAMVCSKVVVTIFIFRDTSNLSLC